ncbi:hypothetical protein [Aquabacterium humicola]|uniref:hypothetical protein n=1 Tax=Aquabacterium humicola TaxID=3237377 RepID=UPI0025438277|nr:hypothetical protein [Rubrivivax pictus]
MYTTTTASMDRRCQCANCPGASCTCGCQHGSAMPAMQAAAAPACHCGPNCGCDAGEQGCLCGTPAAAVLA